MGGIMPDNRHAGVALEPTHLQNRFIADFRARQMRNGSAISYNGQHPNWRCIKKTPGASGRLEVKQVSDHFKSAFQALISS